MKYQELKELIGFFLTLIETIEKVGADRRISVSDIAYFPALIMSAIPAFRNIDKVADEIKMLDKNGVKEISEFIKTDLELNFDVAENFIENMATWILQFLLMYKDWRNEKK